MSKPYSPLDGVRRVTRSMNAYTAKHRPAAETPLHLSATTGPIPCAVLLRSLIEGGPVPDDFKGIALTSLGIREHTRPDGAKFIGAFELQGDRESLVLVYGDASLGIPQAEQIAKMERPALIARHESFLLGPFATQPTFPQGT